MDKKIVDVVVERAKQHKLDAALLLAFVRAETGGQGFDSKTGKIMIQFEPAWFKKKAPYAPSGLWSVNGVERQDKEWIAFNDAFKKNADAAMESTSIGLPQIMGFHYKRLGFQTVGAFWDFMKKSIDNQITALILFIQTDTKLYNAFKTVNYHLMATYYNGAGYLKLAERLKREPYNKTIERYHKSYIAAGY